MQYKCKTSKICVKLQALFSVTHLKKLSAFVLLLTSICIYTIANPDSSTVIVPDPLPYRNTELFDPKSVVLLTQLPGSGNTSSLDC